MNLPERKKKWYLLYTKPRNEKKVNTELQIRGFETYLPIQKTLKQWSDRKKMVEEPLFKSYLFINTTLSFYYDILNVNGIVKFVNFEKSPVVVNENEIKIIKQMLGTEMFLDVVNEKLIQGSKVEVIAGPMIGVKGNIVEYRSKNQIIINLISIQQDIVINVPHNLLKILN
ncbi:MAG: UpxY family transcription antiterminator [Bacteroidetes bacterium]|nr:UpxY family transcription antiterminator [Bacteroidota bacterium]